VQGYPPRRPSNGLGAATFVVVLLGAVLAVFPATAGLGLALCLAAIVPAIVAYLRTRRGAATNPRRSVAAVALAPAFVVVAVVVGAAATPSTSGGVGWVADAGAPQAGGSVAARGVSGTPAGVVGAPQGSVEVAGAPALAPAAPTRAGSPRQAPHTQAARPAVVAPKPAQAPKPAVKPAPVAPKPAPSAGGGCDEDTHYVNVSGNCVLRPVVAAVAPAGASARCKDGTYSSSQHRSGTCSKHGGVQDWLRSLPS